MCSTLLYVAGSVIVAGIVLPLLVSLTKKNKSFHDKHCLITGGSKGIGLQLAIQLAKEGAKVTIVARQKGGLEKARQVVSNAVKGARVHIESVDCTDADKLTQAVTGAEECFGPVDCVIANAGLAIPGYFLEQRPEVFKRQMDVNYMGTVHTIKAIAPGMVERRNGTICVVSSGILAGGFLGYSSYAPTKYAVRALADSLRNEFIGFGVDVCIAYPPDTQSEGFDQENKSKPAETKEISPPEVYDAEKVAEGIVTGMKEGQYHISGPNILQNLIIATSASTSPRSNTVLESFIVAPIINVILQLFRVFHMDRVAARYGQKAKKTQ